MLSVVEARQRIMQNISQLDGETVSLETASDRVLFEDIYSQLDLPPFSNSGMDGFAVHSADVQEASPERPARLAISMDIPAGTTPPSALRPGEAARIMTGAMLPEGADSIVPVEDTDRSRETSANTGNAVSIFRAAQAGDFVRPTGQDLHRGELVLTKGRILRPEDIGLLATLGISQVKVFRQPCVALLSSGDEIVPPEVPLTPGKIHDSNSFMLAALVVRAGGEPYRLGVAADSLESVRSLLDQAIALSVDLILTSAGVSVGAFDFIRTLVEAEGQLDFWRVNMRPGKPVAFGKYKGIPLIGLPGNPVSAYVGFEVFVRPVIAKLSGQADLVHPMVKVVLGEAVESDGRESYLRVVLKNEGSRTVAYLTGHQGSGNLNSLVKANALLIVPSGVKSLPIGAEVDSWLLSKI